MPEDRSLASILEEREQVKLLLKKNSERIDKAKSYYVISKTWWKKYAEYIFLDTEPNPDVKDVDLKANFPGIIKNERLLSKTYGETKFLTGDRLEKNPNYQVFDTFIKHDAACANVCVELINFLAPLYKMDRTIKRLKEKDSSQRGSKNPSMASVKIVRGNNTSERFYVQFNKKENYLALKKRFAEVIRKLHPELNKNKDFG
jgi:hypothetical protein